MQLQRLTAEALKAEASAEAAKQVAKTAKAVFKKARKLAKSARRTAKLARKHVEEASAAMATIASAASPETAQSKTVNRAKRPASIRKTSSKSPSASQVAKAVISRLTTAKPPKKGAESGAAAPGSVDAPSNETESPIATAPADAT